MILVLASGFDEVAPSVVATWPGGRAALLTPADLSARGWCVESGRASSWTLVASGRRVRAADVRGVVNLLPYLPEHELYQVEKADRRYVAAEMRAFLFYLLTRLDCPVLNRPTPHALNGPDWKHEQWALRCRDLGIPVGPTRRDSRLGVVPPPPATSFHSITVVGGRCAAESAGAVAAHREGVVALAGFAGVGFLTARFSLREGDYLFHSVRLIPDLRDPDVLRVVAEHFTGAAGGGGP